MAAQPLLSRSLADGIIDCDVMEITRIGVDHGMVSVHQLHFELMFPLWPWTRGLKYCSVSLKNLFPIQVDMHVPTTFFVAMGRVSSRHTRRMISFQFKILDHRLDVEHITTDDLPISRTDERDGGNLSTGGER